MKTTVRISLVLVLIAGIFAVSSAQVLTTQQQATVKEKIRAMLRNYQEYGGFTQDLEELTNGYFDEFQKLFKPDAQVFNDLVQGGAGGPALLPVTAYMDYVKQHYVHGLSVELKDIVIGEAVFSKTVYVSEVILTKNVSGYEKGVGSLKAAFPMKFTVEIPKALDKVLIARAEKVEPEKKPEAVAVKPAEPVKKPEQKVEEVVAKAPEPVKQPVEEKVKQAEGKVTEKVAVKEEPRKEPVAAKTEEPKPKAKEEPVKEPVVAKAEPPRPKAKEETKKEPVKPAVAEPEAKPGYDRESNTYTLVFKIVDEKDVPLADFRVTLEYEGGTGMNKRSKENGEVVFSGVPAATVVTVTVRNEMYEGGVTGKSDDLAKTVNLVRCRIKEAAIAKVPVSCKVVDENRKGVPEASVKLFYRDAMREKHVASQKGETRFERIPKDFDIILEATAGEYFGRVSGKAEDLAREAVVITIKDTFTYVSFKYTVIHEANKSALAGARVTLTAGNKKHSATTDGRGTLTFPKVRAYQSYGYSVYKAGYKEVSKKIASAVTAAQEISVSLAPLAKPAYAGINLMVGSATFGADDAFADNQISRFTGGALNSGTAMGIGLHYQRCFFQSRKLELYYGLGIGLQLLSSGLAVDHFQGNYLKEANPDAEPGFVHPVDTIAPRSELWEVDEQAGITALEIPLFLEFRYKLGPSLLHSIYFRPGLLVSYALSMNSDYEAGDSYYTRSCYAEGELKNDNVPYPGELEGGSTDFYKSSLSFSATLAAGLTWRLGQSLELQTGGRLDMRSYSGRMNEPDTYGLSRNMQEYNSPLSRSEKVSVQSAGVEIGLLYKF